MKYTNCFVTISRSVKARSVWIQQYPALDYRTVLVTKGWSILFSLSMPTMCRVDFSSACRRLPGTAFDIPRWFQFGMPFACLYSLWLLHSVSACRVDVFVRSSSYCMSLVQFPYLICMFPVSLCQDLVSLQSACQASLFSVTSTVSFFRFSLTFLRLALKANESTFLSGVPRCQKEHCFV
jgi:hypothetical protein